MARTTIRNGATTFEESVEHYTETDGVSNGKHKAITVDSIISNTRGVVGTPIVSLGDVNSGLYSSGANTIDIAANGANVASFGATTIRIGNTNTVVLGCNESIVVACSDESTALTSGAGKVTFRMPYAFKVTGVRASLTTAQTSGSILTIDVNESGTTILSTKLTIDNTKKTSTTAVTAPIISDPDLADDAEMTVDIDQIGDGTAKGLKVYLIGYRSA